MSLSAALENLLLVAPVALPLTAAALAAALNRSRPLQRTVAFAALGLVMAAGLLLIGQVIPADVMATVLGSADATLGIALTVDPLGGGLVVTSAGLGALVIATAAATGEDQHRYFYPLTLALVGGACGSFLTGDLFNLFVFVEVVLAASYGLLGLRGGLTELQDSATYVAINLLGTVILLVGVGAVFGATGTVNLAELSQFSVDASGTLPGAILVMIALALKSALLPLSGWLTVGYPAAPRVLMALFAGIMTTVGMAAIYRVGMLAFQGHDALQTGVLASALATALGGALAAVAARSHARVLAFLIVTQVGFMGIGFGLGTPVALAAGIFFLLQDVVVKTGAVLSLDVLERGLAGRGVAGWLFGVLGLSLVGMPLTAGFVGKALLVDAAMAAGNPLAAAVALLASLLVLAAVVRVWARWMWDQPEARTPHRRTSVASLVVLTTTLGTLLVGLAPQWLFAVAQSAAQILSQPHVYAEQVLPP